MTLHRLLPQIAITLVIFQKISFADDKLMLLDSLHDVRAASLSLVSSGRGVAIAEQEYSYAQGKEIRDIEPHIVDFTFNRTDSLWKIHPDLNKPSFTAVACRKGPLMINYIANMTPITPYVAISQFNKIALNPAIDNWSYGMIAAIPDIAESDFYPLVSRTAAVTVTKEDGEIKVTGSSHVEAQNCDCSWSYIFDMRQGGMLSRYTFTQVFRDPKKKELIVSENSEDKTIKWKQNETAFVPVNYSCEVKYSEAGKVTSDLKDRVEFKEFKCGPVDPEDISLKGMEVKTGTRIINNISKLEWQYAEGDTFQGPDASKHKVIPD
jgi:hypothetical protein